MINTLRKIYRYFPLISHYARIGQIFEGFNSQSYYPDDTNKKDKLSQVIDYLYIFFILRFLPSNYHLYGFDKKDRKKFKKYLGCTNSDPYPTKRFYPLFGRDTVLIDDKLIFNVICSHYKLPVPKIYGLYPDDIKNRLVNFLEDNKLKKVLLKPRFGSNGLGIYFVSQDELNGVDDPPVGGAYIIEEMIEQHLELNKINPHSVNTIRIITILCPDGKIEFLGAMLRTSSTSLQLDNFSTGGIVVGIDLETGKLKREGIVKHILNDALIKNSKNQTELELNAKQLKKRNLIMPGKVLLKHPVTDVEFFNFQLPHWEEVKEATRRAQRAFCHIKSIGWDIAIGPKGPVFVEGNRLWGTVGMQASNGGLLNQKNRAILKKHGISFYE